MAWVTGIAGTFMIAVLTLDGTYNDGKATEELGRTMQQSAVAFPIDLAFDIAVVIAFVGGRPGMISAATGAMALVMVCSRMPM